MATVQVDHNSLMTMLRFVDVRAMSQSDHADLVSLYAAVDRGIKKTAKYSFRFESENSKVYPIKALRQMTDLGLKEAKHAVEGQQSFPVYGSIATFIQSIRGEGWSWAQGKLTLVILDGAREHRRVDL